MKNNGSKIIMGIDPGTNKMGYGVIKVDGNKVEMVVMGYIELSKLKTPYLKLKHIYDRVNAIVKSYSPQEVAFEAPFFGENVQSMLKLGRAQGVAIAAALNSDVEVFEYAPTKVKIAITGSGQASKERVARMLQKILNIDQLPKNLDSTDGLAVALCHHFTSSSVLTSTGGAKGWKEFITNNPNRIIK